MATFTVTTLIDEDDAGAMVADSGGVGLSLREAVTLANDADGADRIEFADDLSGLMRMAGSQINIRNDALEIDGGGRITITGDIDNNDRTAAGDISTLSGNGTAQLSDNVRAFFVREGADTTLIGLTLTGGRTRNEGGHGGVVYSQADVTLIDSLVSGNSTSADNAKGGGLFSRTSITLINSTVTDNSTVGDNSDGGALAVELQDGFEGTGAITLTNSTVSDSLTTGEYASGGGIYTQGALTITGSVVEENRTTGYNSQGGGTYSQGAQTITGSRIIENFTTNYRNYGGGAFSEDALTVIDSTIDGNFTTGRAAAGGGLYAGRKLVVTGSSITNNRTEDRNAEGGGAYAKFSGVEITDSVLSGNNTNGDFSGGGGIAASSKIYLTNTTISGNSTNGLRSDGGGVSGSGIYLINSTITSNRTLGEDSDGGGVATRSIRLSSENSIVLGNDVLTGDGDEMAQGNSPFNIGILTLTGRNIIGSDEGALSDSISINDSSTGTREYAEPTQIFAETAAVGGAMGGVLADNGGPVQTVALNADAANPALNVAGEGATAADARGVEATSGRDLGAYELITDENLVVTTGDDVLDATDGVISLREAVYLSNQAAGPNTITFAAGVEDTIRLTEGEVLIFDDLTIDGGGRITITGDANSDDVTDADGITDVAASSDAGTLDDNSRIFYSIGQNETLTINGLTLTGGFSSNSNSGGGGAVRVNGDVSILNSTISGNSTSADSSSGGGVFARGDATVVSSTVAGNSTGGDYSRGGGVFAGNAITVTDSTITGNSTAGTGGRGGGVYSFGVVVANSTIAGNSTSGMRADGGGVFAFRDAIITGSTITGNSTAASDAEGGGAFAGADTVGGGTLTVANSIVLGNVAQTAEGDELFKDTSSSSNDGLIGLIGTNILGADSAAFDVTNQATGGGSAQNAVAAEVFAATTDNNGVLAGVLADNGGPVQTVALRAVRDNPALDASSNNEPDGRGLPRVDLDFLDNGGIADLGAFELQDQILFAPSFTIGSAFLIAENQTNVGTISASDDGGGILFAITGGADAAFFAINAVSGALTFSASPDFEAPQDANRNNIYLVTVRATDNEGISEDQTFSVTVTDVADTANPPTAPNPLPGPAGPTAGDDTLVGTAQNDRIDALGGNDDVSGLAGDDVLRGAAGDDSLRGNGGDDTLRGNGGDDNIKGNGGEDLIRGNGGDDVIRAGGAADNVKGGGGADLIFGGGGADQLNGGGGADTLRGNGGDDTLKGNGGADVFQFRASDRNDTILDFRQGQDQIEILSGASSFAQLSIEQDGRDVLIGFGNGHVNVVTHNAGEFDESDFIF